MEAPNTWRILVIDDQQARETADYIESQVKLPDGANIQTKVVEKFQDALVEIETRRCDLVVLDLRDDSVTMDEDDRLPGLEVYEQLKATRFVPIVFYTALPNRIPNDDQCSPCVWVVERGQYDQLVEAVQNAFASGTMQLSRHIENELREYFWSTVREHWRDISGEAVAGERRVDLVYLLSRRLAAILRQPSARRLIANQGGSRLAPENAATVHPIEMYIYPVPDGAFIRSGYICKNSDEDKYWVIMTPTCDFAQCKAERVLLAGANKFSEHDSVTKIIRRQNEEQTFRPSRSQLGELDRWMRHKDERYAYFPGTFFMPDLLVDFQDLRQIEVVKGADGELLLPSEYEQVAMLDTPFSEALTNRFAKYYGRIGTPDLDTSAARLRLGIRLEQE